MATDEEHIRFLQALLAKLRSERADTERLAQRWAGLQEHLSLGTVGGSAGTNVSVITNAIPPVQHFFMVLTAGSLLVQEVARRRLNKLLAKLARMQERIESIEEEIRRLQPPAADENS